jgi:hypothetical protein
MDKGGEARRLRNKAIGDRLSCGIDGRSVMPWL